MIDITNKTCVFAFEGDEATITEWFSTTDIKQGDVVEFYVSEVTSYNDRTCVYINARVKEN